MLILRLLIGAGLLLLGRRLFWVFVGATGFIVALSFVADSLQGRPEWLVLLLALAAGAVGAILAIFLQRLAAVVAGFLAGGYIGLTALELLSLEAGNLRWLVYAAAGLVGAILISAVFDWGLIVLSSLAGASLIAQSLDIRAVLAGLVFFVLLVVGLAGQSAQLRRAESRISQIPGPQN